MEIRKEEVWTTSVCILVPNIVPATTNATKAICSTHTCNINNKKKEKIITDNGFDPSKTYFYNNFQSSLFYHFLIN